MISIQIGIADDRAVLLRDQIRIARADAAHPFGKGRKAQRFFFKCDRRMLDIIIVDRKAGRTVPVFDRTDPQHRHSLRAYRIGSYDIS